MNGLKHVLTTMERKAEVSQTAPERYSALRAIADDLSRKNVDLAICELMNEVLARTIELCYQCDSGGLCNIDSVTGKILFSLAWGRNGQKRWLLKPQEANILRQILFDWQTEPPALLFYERSRRAWFVDLSAFGSIGIAKAWIRSHQITVGLYRSARAKRLA